MVILFSLFHYVPLLFPRHMYRGSLTTNIDHDSWLLIININEVSNPSLGLYSGKLQVSGGNIVYFL